MSDFLLTSTLNCPKFSKIPITRLQRPIGPNPLRIILVSKTLTYTQNISSKAIGQLGRFPRQLYVINRVTVASWIFAIGVTVDYLHQFSNIISLLLTKMTNGHGQFGKQTIKKLIFIIFMVHSCHYLMKLMDNGKNFWYTAISIENNAVTSIIFGYHLAIHHMLQCRSILPKSTQ